MTNSRPMRTDIQALRAVAVLMVVLFHLWPSLIPGGFAGVDVFFVISGYLISRSLFNELEATNSLSLGSFWAKRVRRLLPAGVVVILASTLIALVFVPPFTRGEFAMNGLASLFYVENWHLVFSATDYFAETNASPFQHFWSLAVEEQFYLVWPLLLLMVTRLTRVKNTKRIPSFVGVVTVASLVAASFLVVTDPIGSYFNSLLRVWEFGLGASIAIALQRVASGSPKSGGLKNLHTLAVAIGFSAILCSAVIFNGGMGFPGLTALLPTFGAGAVIFSGGMFVSSTTTKIMETRSLQFVGNISYSLYLWHWPLIILTPYVLGHALNDFEKPVLLAVAIGIAWFTKRFIEDKLRMLPRLVDSRPRVTFAVALIATLVVAGGLTFSAGSNVFLYQSSAAKLDFAKHDAADLGSKCMTKAENTDVILCHFGSTAGYRVLLVGDSHAASHLAAFKRIALRHKWSLTLAYKAGCSFSNEERNPGWRGQACATWNRLLSAKLAKVPSYDLVVTANYSNNYMTETKDASLPQRRIEGFQGAWLPLIERGAQVLAIRDNPQMTQTMFSCYSQAVNDASNCRDQKSKMLFRDESQVAADGLQNAHSLDLIDLYCGSKTCSATRHGVYIYRNADHITARYSAYISNLVYQRLERLLRQN